MTYISEAVSVTSHWLSLVPWQPARLKDVASVVNGFPFDASQFDKSMGMRVIRVRDLSHDNDPVYWNNHAPSSAVVADGDIIVGMDGDFNCVLWHKGTSLLNQRLCSVKPGPTVHSRFLAYCLPHPLKIINDLTYFTTVKHLSSFQVLDIRVPMPGIETQIAIADFLDRKTTAIDTLIDREERLIALLEEKRQALITQAVTKGIDANVPMKDSGIEWLGKVPAHWTIVRLKRCIRAGTSISYGIVQPGEQEDDGVPFVQTTNLTRGELDPDCLQRTARDIECRYPRSRLATGDVLLGIRASIGDAAVVPAGLDGCNLSRGIARIVPARSVRNHFVVHYLHSSAARSYWDTELQGSTFSEVSIATVRELPVPVPPIDEQDSISAYLDIATNRHAKTVDVLRRQVNLLREYRQALITAAVTGKIDVTKEAVS